MPEVAKFHIKKIDQYGDLTIWEVDGAKIRAKLDIEFSGFAQHSDKPYIPEDELWLEHEHHPDEHQFFIDHMLAQWKAEKRGQTHEQAMNIAYKVEKSERQKSGDQNKIIGPDHRRHSKNVHKRLLGTTDDGLEVWLVNGRLVRSDYYLDYVEGGHHIIYPWVPEKEIWLDDDLDPSEYNYVLLHELHERSLMAKGWSYTKAHPDSSKIELYCHHHPHHLKEELARLGWPARRIGGHS